MTSQRFEVDPKINDLEKELKQKELSSRQKSDKKIIPVFIAGIVLPVTGLYVIALVEAPESSPVLAVIGVAMTIWVVRTCIRVFRRNVTPEVEQENKDRERKRRSIKRSIKVAKDAGDAVPVLTKEHVEAGFRFDSIMMSYEPEMTVADEAAIRALHLSDLSREAAIFSLIGERGLTTIGEVTAALAEMESNKKPLQSGWL